MARLKKGELFYRWFEYWQWPHIMQNPKNLALKFVQNTGTFEQYISYILSTEYSQDYFITDINIDRQRPIGKDYVFPGPCIPLMWWYVKRVEGFQEIVLC